MFELDVKRKNKNLMSLSDEEKDPK